MRVRKLVLLLASTALLLFGIGAASAIAHDDPPATSPEACTVVAPGGATEHAADAVENAAQDVREEADDQEGDDDQGDAEDQDDQHGEQGDCENEDEDDGDDGNGGDDD